MAPTFGSHFPQLKHGFLRLCEPKSGCFLGTPNLDCSWFQPHFWSWFGHECTIVLFIGKLKHFCNGSSRLRSWFLGAQTHQGSNHFLCSQFTEFQMARLALLIDWSVSKTDQNQTSCSSWLNGNTSWEEMLDLSLKQREASNSLIIALECRRWKANWL